MMVDMVAILGRIAFVGLAEGDTMDSEEYVVGAELKAMREIYSLFAIQANALCHLVLTSEVHDQQHNEAIKMVMRNNGQLFEKFQSLVSLLGERKEQENG